MASTTKLRFTLQTSDGSKYVTINEVDPEVPSSEVRALGNSLVTNSSSLFIYTFSGVNAAEMITTTTTDIPMS